MKLVRFWRDLPSPVGRRGFVPTMGALHEGHLALVRRAKQDCKEVVVSIFVNPTQFGPAEDFNRYPRTLESDLKLLEDEGVDFCYAPGTEDVYPYGPGAVEIQVNGLDQLWEGAARPGHFNGVATVVSRLFFIVQPHIAFFGQKDLQQTRIILRVVSAMGIPVQIEVCPTVREADGLALSSRNQYLSAEDRRKAPELYGALTRIKSSIEANAGKYARDFIGDSLAKLTENLDIEYLALVDGESLQEIEIAQPGSFLITAAKLGGVRLIDNVAINLS